MFPSLAIALACRLAWAAATTALWTKTVLDEVV